MKVTFLSVCLCVAIHVARHSAQEISGDILARELDKVADSVGWSFLQVHDEIKQSLNLLWIRLLKHKVHNRK